MNEELCDEGSGGEFSFSASLGDEGVRLDKVVASHFTDISRTRISNLIEQKMITVNGKLPKGKDKVKAGDIVSVTLPEVREAEVLPEDIPLDILYEDEDVLVVNKPKGMVVHPAPGHMNGTLVNACLFHCGDLSGINGVLRPGIVHRIDMDTTGSVIVCKNDRAHRAIADELKEHKIVRKYDAIVCGVMREAQGTVNAPLGRSKRDRKKMAVDPSGKRAVTHYVVREQFRDCAWLSLQLETGRTHQIRVHMAYINRPVLGDGIYGGGGALRVSESLKLDGQCLHARVLGFHQPTTGEYIETQAPLPEYFENLLKRFRRE